MLSRKSRFALLSSAVAVGTLLSAQASVNDSSATGLRPDQLAPFWTSYDDSSATHPTVKNDVMTLAAATKLDELSSASLGSAINGYHDNALMPLLTGAVIHDPTMNCEEAEGGFGDASKKNSGGSEWEYLWHNTSCVPINAVPEPTAAALLLAGALLLGCRKLRRN